MGLTSSVHFSQSWSGAACCPMYEDHCYILSIFLAVYYRKVIPSSVTCSQLGATCTDVSFILLLGLICLAWYILQKFFQRKPVVGKFSEFLNSGKSVVLKLE